MSSQEEAKKPTLHLLSSKNAFDLGALRDLYVKLTGREPTPEELKEAEDLLKASQ